MPTKAKKTEQGPGRPRNKHKCLRCGETGGTIRQRQITRNGRVYKFYVNMHHEYLGKGKSRTRDCYLNKKMSHQLGLDKKS